MLNVRVGISSFDEALYGIDSEELTEKAGEVIRERTETLFPYLAEAMLRGRCYTDELQDLYGRKGAVQAPLGEGLTPLLEIFEGGDVEDL
jgi:hypothetical protein